MNSNSYSPIPSGRSLFESDECRDVRRLLEDLQVFGLRYRVRHAARYFAERFPNPKVRNKRTSELLNWLEHETGFIQSHKSLFVQNPTWVKEQPRAGNCQEVIVSFLRETVKLTTISRNGPQTSATETRADLDLLNPQLDMFVGQQPSNFLLLRRVKCREVV